MRNYHKRGKWKVVNVGKIVKGKKYTVTKSKTLNEASVPDFTLQELRILCIYLGMINPAKPETRAQSFSLDNFNEIMELDRTQPRQLEDAFRGLLKKPIILKNSDGEMIGFPLFSVVELCKDGKGGWAVELSASENAMPLMFKLREEWQYFKYNMWHALKLKSRNQLRLYEWLKQHEYQATKAGKYVTVADLKSTLDIKENVYPEYRDFKKYVLEPCRKAIEDRTDIAYIYEVAEKAAHGRTYALLFKVKKNPARAHEDQLRLDEFRTMIEGAVNGGAAAAAPPGFFDKKTARRGAGLLTKFQATDMMLAQGEIEDPYEQMEAGGMTGDELELYACWVATEREFGPEELKVLRNEVQNNWASYGYRRDPNYDSSYAAKAANMARHFKYWYDYAKNVETEGGITHSLFSYLRKIIGGETNA